MAGESTLLKGSNVEGTVGERKDCRPPFQCMRIEVPLTSSTISSKDTSEKTPERRGQHRGCASEYRRRDKGCDMEESK